MSDVQWHAFLPSCSNCYHTSICWTEGEAVPQISSIKSIDHKIPAFVSQVAYHFVLLYATRGSGDKSPASNPRQTWDLWWAKWYWDQFLSEFFALPLQYHSSNAPYSQIHLSLMLYSLSNWQRQK